MGKSKKPRRVGMLRSDPTKPERNGVAGSNGTANADGQLVKTSVIETIEAQLTSGQSPKREYFPL